MANLRMFLPAPTSLVPALLAEASLLGRASPGDGGVWLEGPPALLGQAHLQLRTATRVWVELWRGPAYRDQELAEGLWKVDLGPYRAAGPVTIEALSVRSPLKVQDLIRLAGQALGVSTTGLDEEAPAGLRLRLRVESGQAALLVDASGRLLFRRGWRQEVGRAPLRETLAAAMLQQAGVDPAMPLWDPLCGSGTIAIEAALRALKRPVTHDGPLAFESWPGFDRAGFERLRAQLESEALKALPAPILATDLNAGALGTARRNARRAGLEGLLRLERHDATHARPGLPKAGWVVANLPYGKRVGDPEDLPPLYLGLGLMLRESAPGWRVALLHMAPELEPTLALKDTTSTLFENGGIRGQLLVGTV